MRPIRYLAAPPSLPYKMGMNKPPHNNSRRPRNNRPGNGSNNRGQNRSAGNTPPSGIKPRRAALRLLNHVLEEGKPLDEGLAFHLGELEGPDRGLARAIASTALRRLGQIDALIKPHLQRPLKRKAARARHALIMGTAEMIFMDTPPHAAISIAVSLTKQDRDSAALSGLVNAVLRRVSENGKDDRAGQDAARLNTPNWLWDRWVKAWGEDRARAIAAQHLAEAPLDITPKHGAPDHADALDAKPLPLGTLRRASGGAITGLPGFTDGDWWIQDWSAALPARLLAPAPGAQVLDLCAAPGGKTMQLAAMGATVTALDISDNRMERVEQNLERTDLDATLITADALEFEADQPFDAVLLDAPCSATGTIRRHPDLPHIKTTKDVKALTKLQADLIDKALTMVKPGGTMLYCTCSLEREEGEDQITAALARHDGLTLTPFTAAETDGLPDDAVTDNGEIRLLPYFWRDLGGMDGFFIARLTKAR